MKTTSWLILGAMLSTSLLAQQVTNPPPSTPIATPAPAPAATSAAMPEASALAAPAKTNAPAAKSAKKKSAPKKKIQKKPAIVKKESPKDAGAELKTVPLVAGPAVVVASHVNVRGQASLKADVVTRLAKDEAVTVLEEIVRNNSAADEPSAWAKILLPPGTHVWVNGAFLDAANNTVKSKKLNVRNGPGENFSVLGLLHQGDTVTALTNKGDWIQLDAPTNAYGFVAAQFLKQVPAEAVPATPAAPATPPVVEAPKPVEPTPTPAMVTEPPVVAAAPTETPAVPAVPATPPPAPAITAPPVVAAPVTPPVAATPAPETNTAPAEAAAPAAEEPPPVRVVQREGLVRGTVSIQAPTQFSLVSAENGRLIDYLFTSSANLDLRRYKGLRIIVTGEEGLDERWGNTPVITIQKIQVVSDGSDKSH